MSNHRKKPVVIQAIQWDGTESGCQKIKDHFPQLVTLAQTTYLGKPEVSYWKIGTLEGGHEVTPGDWIIQGVKGELYPCKPDIFAATYEPAETTTSSSPLPALAVEPVAEVEESYTGMYSDGMYRAVVVSHERLSVGAELYLHADQLEAECQRRQGYCAACAVKIHEPLYSLAQVKEQVQRAVNEALERAAKECDKFERMASEGAGYVEHWGERMNQVARHIRAMKEKP